ncbi:MAG: GTP cyclohydrolase I, partial [Bacteroidota bacterium]
MDAYEKGEMHLAGSPDTPLREDAFAMDDDLKMELIARHFREIMNVLGLDLNDDSLKGTPDRVAKMYVKEIFSGLNPANKPRISVGKPGVVGGLGAAKNMRHKQFGNPVRGSVEAIIIEI